MHPTPTSVTRADLARTVTDIAPVLESWLELRRAIVRTPGVQVAIRVDGELVFSTALGFADAERGEALTTSHLFRIASHSKTFAATACLLLREDGVLRLDDTVGQWVAELADSPLAPVTVRELLGHQAGVIRDGLACDFWGLDGDFPDEAQLIATLTRAGATFEPNTYFKYSNFGYSIIGVIVARAAGAPFEDVIRERILDVLDLPRIYPDLRCLPDQGELSWGHSDRLDGDDDVFALRHADTGAMCAATGFIACAEDLTAYIGAHTLGDPRLLTDASKRIMQRLESIVMRDDTEEGRYGIGMDLHRVGSRHLVGHSGGFPGFITRTYLDPHDSLVVSVLTNQSGGPAGDLAEGLIKLIDLAATPSGRARAIADAERYGGRYSPAGTRETEPSRDASAFCGRFVCSVGRCEIAVFGTRLVAFCPSDVDPTATAQELLILDDDTLIPIPCAGFGPSGEPWRFSRDGDGRIIAVTYGGLTWRPEADFRARRRRVMSREV